MAKASIALNRFGLGGRPGDAPGADPARWLVAQLDRYDARPAAIAALAPSPQIVAEIADYRRELRDARRATRGNAAPSPQMDAEPAMRASPMADAPAMAAMPKRRKKPDDPTAQVRRDARLQARDHYGDAVAARALTALTSPAPFVERLAHFWANHFAVSADKLEMVGLAGSLEFEAVRPHVLGKFGDMLHAVERHPAMLLYLDQAQSVGPNSALGQLSGRRGQKAGLNENLAREILELHTLGVRTGYSQADVTEFARAMTGWTVAGLRRGGAPNEAGGSFVFAPRLHEPGTRTILGKSWPQPGEAQAASVLDLLATHPATARHIATKLARHFAADDPPPALVARLETAFLRSGGDLPTVYRALVDAPECWVAQPVKFKSPWEWTISALRGLGAQQLPPMAMNGLMTQLGQPVWKPGSPAGWDDVAGSWAGPDAVMRRVEAAERLAQRTRDTVDARQRAAELFPDALSESTAQSIARAESPGQGVALMLVAPEFMRR
ncbi:uncharacterized protein (DUF1800 family) [Sphingomonas naasensis]|uniref:DUF1800 domain-containing protein n=1 Tax=Sphingomonas naasensis TaxID=1344951 RepID=A0A4S1WRC2_9SPHN|nr:DUF1800 domain-containing protein [Sphingomonas naasensis]NIJ20620.1 uncharacterized protein (DUF1800 family) [Sphingomonas naasensis]TGX44697.1 DUF1800 domain-containing protein [Sphingomonas naasensis]